MNVTSVMPSVPTSANNANLRAAPAPSQNSLSAASAGVPVDMVSLSTEAKKAMAGVVSFAVPSSGGASAPGMPDLKDFGQIVAARSQLAEQESAYAGKLNDVVRATFGVPDDSGWSVGGAGFAVLDKLAAAHGLQKPDIPKILADAGQKDPFAGEADAQAGVFGFTVTAANAPNRGAHMEVAFDRASTVPPDQMRVAALKKDDPSSSSLIAQLQGGSLSRFVDASADLKAGSGTSLFVVTDGASGSNAKVAGAIRSTGMDDVAGTSGLAVLKAVKSVLAN